MSDIQLGSQVIHSVTGFTGIATGRAIYLSGCVNLLVKPKVDKEGKMREGHWIDENELEVVEAAEHEELKPTGGPRPEEPPK